MFSNLNFLDHSERFFVHFGKIYLVHCGLGYFLEFSVIRNRARWTEMLVTILPAIRLSAGSFGEILPISVLDLGLIRVGEVIWGRKEIENIMSKKFAKSLFSSLFNKPLLKSRSSSMSSFGSFDNFVLSSNRKQLLISLRCMLGCL